MNASESQVRDWLRRIAAAICGDTRAWNVVERELAGAPARSRELLELATAVRNRAREVTLRLIRLRCDIELVHERVVRKLAKSSLARNPHVDVVDAFQQKVQEFLENPARYEPRPDRLVAWWTQVVRNRMLDDLRRAEREERRMETFAEKLLARLGSSGNGSGSDASAGDHGGAPPSKSGHRRIKRALENLRISIDSDTDPDSLDGDLIVAILGKETGLEKKTVRRYLREMYPGRSRRRPSRQGGSHA